MTAPVNAEGIEIAASPTFALFIATLNMSLDTGTKLSTIAPAKKLARIYGLPVAVVQYFLDQFDRMDQDEALCEGCALAHALERFPQHEMNLIA